MNESNELPANPNKWHIWCIMSMNKDSLTAHRETLAGMGFSLSEVHEVCGRHRLHAQIMKDNLSKDDLKICSDWAVANYRELANA